MFLFLLVDFYHNDIIFIRKHEIYPILVICSYGVLNTILTIFDGPVYPTITFRDASSFLIVGFSFLLLIIVFEICIRVTKRRYLDLPHYQENLI